MNQLAGAASRSRRWTLLACLLAAVPSFVLLWLPVYSIGSVSHSAGPTGLESSTAAVEGATLSAVNGSRALLPLLMPMLLTLAPLLMPGRAGRRVAAYVCAGLLMVFVVLAGFSIGMFYAPSAVAMVLAAVQRPLRPAAA